MEAYQLLEQNQEYQEAKALMAEVEPLLVWQQSPEFQCFKGVILAFISQDNAGMPLYSYGIEPAAETALKNEMIRFYKEGMERSLTLITDLVNTARETIQDLEEDAKREAQTVNSLL